jgi:hypothetical protein
MSLLHTFLIILIFEILIIGSIYSFEDSNKSAYSTLDNQNPEKSLIDKKSTKQKFICSKIMNGKRELKSILDKLYGKYLDKRFGKKHKSINSRIRHIFKIEGSNGTKLKTKKF